MANQALINKHSRAPLLIVEDRWVGDFGIGRYSKEILSRLLVPYVSISTTGKPPSPIDPVRLELSIRRAGRPSVLYNPGYNAPLTRGTRSLLTIHDIMHLTVTDESSPLRRAYYELLVKPALRHARMFFTVSHWSRDEICEWAGLPQEAGIVATNGLSASFTAAGDVHKPGYPYLLYVGNTKPHKNVPRLLQALAKPLRQHRGLRLVLVGREDAETILLARDAGVERSVVFSGPLDDSALAAHYRGALALVIPSLTEGFGMPALEAQACGTPVVSSHGGALPEVCGDAALFVDAKDVESIADGLQRIISGSELRSQLVEKGLQRCRKFCWSQSAAVVDAQLSLALAHH